MPRRSSSLPPRTSSQLATQARAAARAVADVAAKGVPAMRAALHGARLGAGRALSPEVIESLGLRVVPEGARRLGDAAASAAGDAALVLRRGGGVLRAGAGEIVLHAREGLTLRVSRGGVAATTVSREAVHAVARSSARTALYGVGRAAAQGAAAGAVLEGAIASVTAVSALRSGRMNRRAAARHVGIHTARGAFAGAAGVAAAGAVSAGIAATGLTIVGAPVAIPLVAMVAAGTLAGRLFDRALRRHPDVAQIPVVRAQ